MTEWLKYHEEPITLHSFNQKSHWFVDGDVIFADEKLRNSVLELWEAQLFGCEPPYLIEGIPTGGTQWADALKERFPKHIYGAYKPQGKVMEPNTWVVVDDVLTSGISMRDASYKLGHCDTCNHVMKLVVARRSAYPVDASWVDLFYLDNPDPM